ncbi:MAG: hypothetical protein ABSF24_09645 [Candidatus Bathyarchaeia archaeon]|jgi:hypothetical protein
MKGLSSEEHRRKKHPQKTLVEFDKKLETHFKGIEDAMFDRETRNATLGSEEFHPPAGTIFEAIFKELKRKEEHERRKHSLSNIISRLRGRRDKHQITLQSA